MPKRTSLPFSDWVHTNFLVIQSQTAENPPFPSFDKLRTGFDTLRANGAAITAVQDFPFVLRPV
jgi:hypothetical protein